MWICPNCKHQQNTELTVCLACAYDGSLDVLRYPTLVPKYGVQILKHADNSQKREQCENVIWLIKNACTAADYEKAKEAFQALQGINFEEVLLRFCDNRISEIRNGDLPCKTTAERGGCSCTE